MNKYNKHTKFYERAKQTISSSDKLYRKRVQDKILDKKVYEFFLTIIEKTLATMRMVLCQKCRLHRRNSKFIVDNKKIKNLIQSIT